MLRRTIECVYLRKAILIAIPTKISSIICFCIFTCSATHTTLRYANTILEIPLQRSAYWLMGSNMKPESRFRTCSTPLQKTCPRYKQSAFQREKQDPNHPFTMFYNSTSCRNPGLQAAQLFCPGHRHESFLKIATTVWL